jgi:hypothetical protein
MKSKSIIMIQQQIPTESGYISRGGHNKRNMKHFTAEFVAQLSVV